MLIGGPKLAPTLSPKKTWSGVITGAVFAYGVSYVYIKTFIPTGSKFVFVSGFVIIGSIVGDLIESKAKRVLNIKDTGKLLPGHGGICDRLDSFMMATYVFMLFKWTIL
jgi:phosphatidate cytidylyltransferase